MFGTGFWSDGNNATQNASARLVDRRVPAPVEAAAEDGFHDQVVGRRGGADADADVDLPDGRYIEVSDEEDLLLLADAQTSGGLLVAGELPGATVIGELVPRRDSVLIIR